jgi:hypothetical protein
MTRTMPFALLLATGVVLSQDTSEARQAAAEAQQQTQDTQARPDAAQAKPEAVQAQTPGAQREREEPPAQGGEPQSATDGDAKLTSVPGGNALGMSILGNQEAPKSLVIVPWKTSELGGSPGVSLMLDDSRQPVDKDVFMRALRYHEIRSETTHPEGATGGSRQNAAAESGAPQSTAARRR